MELRILCVHGVGSHPVYTFLDDAPIEERRTQAVYTHRASELRTADDLGALDQQAIERVRQEVWPSAETSDELHDALLLAGFIRRDEAVDAAHPEQDNWPALFDDLVRRGQAVECGDFWVPIERFEEFDAVVPQPSKPFIPERIRKHWSTDEALRELARGRMEIRGPVTAAQLARVFGFADTRLIDQALIALEVEGKILRGAFTSNRYAIRSSPGSEAASADRELEWCDRRLLARIHRYTLHRLRAEIEPATAAEFMRFLLHWQHVAQDSHLRGNEGLAAVIDQLDGYEIAADAWERDVLPARVADYTSNYIDALCLSGRVAWGRLTPMQGAGKSPVRSSLIALMPRDHVHVWRASEDLAPEELSSEARAVYDVLIKRGASFFHELVAGSALLPTMAERALGELVSAGIVTADSFSGLRALLTPLEKRSSLGSSAGGRNRRRTPIASVDTGGRWALLGGGESADRVETIARLLLKRYGVVFRSLLVRESGLPTWRKLAMVYRRLEARGEIRGGRFVNGFGGEQFASADAVGRLRSLRKLERSGEFISLSGADPLNLVGTLTPDSRVAAIARNRILFRDGLAIAAWEGGAVRRLAASDLSDEALRSLIVRRVSSDLQRPYFRSETKKEQALLDRKRSMEAISSA